MLVSADMFVLFPAGGGEKRDRAQFGRGGEKGKLGVSAAGVLFDFFPELVVLLINFPIRVLLANY
jgi:hypothetical protein